MEKSKLCVADDIGQVFFSKDKVLRGINPKWDKHVMDLLKSGLLKELESRELFPKTEITNLKLEGFNIVLEHEKIDRIVYPYEWSPEMLRQAAICVLDVNECANKYGYELKDVHPYNILFKFNKPIYVDFGSFVKKKYKNNWIAYEEFIRVYINVLRLAEKQYFDIYKNCFLVRGIGYSSIELMCVNNKIYNLIGMKYVHKIYNFSKKYKKLKSIDFSNNNLNFKKLFLFSLQKILFLSKKNELENYFIKNKINSFSLKYKSEWGDYQESSGFLDSFGKIKLSDRFKWILDKIDNLNIKSVIEIAGNQGVLAREISNLKEIKEVICTDYDMQAIDSAFIRSKSKKIYFATFDFLGDVQELLKSNRSDRLKCDLVLALALTHHLILSQGYSIDLIFSQLSNYTNKYVIVEFMPLGLWDGVSAPELPNWYSEKWFLNKMEKYFYIREIKELEINRTVIIGEKIIDI